MIGSNNQNTTVPPPYSDSGRVEQAKEEPPMMFESFGSRARRNIMINKRPKVKKNCAVVDGNECDISNLSSNPDEIPTPSPSPRGDRASMLKLYPTRLSVRMKAPSIRDIDSIFLKLDMLEEEEDKKKLDDVSPEELAGQRLGDLGLGPSSLQQSCPQFYDTELYHQQDMHAPNEVLRQRPGEAVERSPPRSPHPDDRRSQYGQNTDNYGPPHDFSRQRFQESDRPPPDSHQQYPPPNRRSSYDGPNTYDLDRNAYQDANRYDTRPPSQTHPSADYGRHPQNSHQNYSQPDRNMYQDSNRYDARPPSQMPRRQSADYGRRPQNSHQNYSQPDRNAYQDPNSYDARPPREMSRRQSADYGRRQQDFEAQVPQFGSKSPPGSPPLQRREDARPSHFNPQQSQFDRMTHQDGGPRPPPFGPEASQYDRMQQYDGGPRAPPFDPQASQYDRMQQYDQNTHRSKSPQRELSSWQQGSERSQRLPDLRQQTSQPVRREQEQQNNRETQEEIAQRQLQERGQQETSDLWAHFNRVAEKQEGPSMDGTMPAARAPAASASNNSTYDRNPSEQASRRSSLSMQDRNSPDHRSRRSSLSMYDRNAPDPTSRRANLSRMMSERMMSDLDTKPKAGSEFNQIEIEISPGVMLPMRGAGETEQAVRLGKVRVTMCFCCQVPLTVIETAEFVYCPACLVIGPLDFDRLKDGSVVGGVGLGLTDDTMAEILDKLTC